MAIEPSTANSSYHLSRKEQSSLLEETSGNLYRHVLLKNARAAQQSQEKDTAKRTEAEEVLWFEVILESLDEEDQEKAAPPSREVLFAALGLSAGLAALIVAFSSTVK